MIGCASSAGVSRATIEGGIAATYDELYGDIATASEPTCDEDWHGTTVTDQALAPVESIVVPIQVISAEWPGPTGHPGARGIPHPVAHIHPTSRASFVGWGLAEAAMMAMQVIRLRMSSMGSAYRQGSLIGIVELALADYQELEPFGKTRDAVLDEISRFSGFLRRQGFPLVAAAGNDHRDARNTYPCIGDGIICVGSHYGMQMSAFTNFGNAVDIFEVGEHIVPV